MTTVRQNPHRGENPSGPNLLLDTVMQRIGVATDKDMSTKLGVAPTVISKIRHHVLEVSASMMIKIHDAAGLSINEIRTFLPKAEG